MASSVKQRIARPEAKPSVLQKAGNTLYPSLKRKADGDKSHENGQVAKKAKPSAPNMPPMPSYNDLLSMASQVSKQGSGSPILTNAVSVAKSTKDKKADGMLLSQEEKDRIEYLNSPEYKHWQQHGGPMPSREKVLSRYKQQAAAAALAKIPKVKSATDKHSSSTAASHTPQNKLPNVNSHSSDKSKQDKTSTGIQLSKAVVSSSKGDKDVMRNVKDISKSSSLSSSKSAIHSNSVQSKKSNGENAKSLNGKDVRLKDSSGSKNNKTGAPRQEFPVKSASNESLKKSHIDAKKTTFQPPASLSKSDSDKKANAFLNKMTQMGYNATKSAEILEKVQRHMQRMQEEANKRLGGIPKKISVVPKGGKVQSNNQSSSRSASSNAVTSSSSKLVTKPGASQQNFAVKSSSSHSDKKSSKSASQTDGKKLSQARSSSDKKYVQVSETVVQCKPAQPASPASKLTGIRAQFADDKVSTWDQIYQRYPNMARMSLALIHM